MKWVICALSNPLLPQIYTEPIRTYRYIYLYLCVHMCISIYKPDVHREKRRRKRKSATPAIARKTDSMVRAGKHSLNDYSLWNIRAMEIMAWNWKIYQKVETSSRQVGSRWGTTESASKSVTGRNRKHWSTTKQGERRIDYGREKPSRSNKKNRYIQHTYMVTE